MKSLINRKIKPFVTNAYHDGTFKEFSSATLNGHWCVFFFYPADFTFVCPTELGELADLYSHFAELNCEILSISTDSHFVHKAWAAASETIAKIRFPMLADPTGAICKSFGVLIPKTGQALRGTFVVNPEGEIKAYEVHDNSIGRNADELLRKLQAAQFVAEHGDQVCPAKWQPGEETLTPSLDLIGKL